MGETENVKQIMCVKAVAQLHIEGWNLVGFLKIFFFILAYRSFFGLDTDNFFLYQKHTSDAYYINFIDYSDATFV